ncbi:ABC transporter ATP-binding protein [uncultured Desulfobacter sp.]|uniref:ABC transporter ATP-binding protein n=1 Tax=uncultured Desulfobacter sp. TaxID=240139 RepID=UPI002AA67518|nr:ABC transporter ATP-binding protein [uncultured Desulfobacter sp.]
MSFLCIDHVTYGYGETPVLNDINLTLEKGEVVSLLGPNGSGKTTLLKVLLGLCRPQKGEVRLEGRPVRHMNAKALARRVAYVPQTHKISFAYRVIDVVLMGRMPHKPFFFRYSKQDEDQALEALEQLSIAHLKDRPYTEVSGGERQMTLIARALAQGADILVMDEPVSGLDYGNQIRLLAQIATLADNGYTFIKTTHFPEHAVWISDRVVMLKKGRLLANGDALEVVNEENLYLLYNTDIGMANLDEGLRVCVPRTMLDHVNKKKLADSFNCFTPNPLRQVYLTH